MDIKRKQRLRHADKTYDTKKVKEKEAKYFSPLLLPAEVKKML